jgi:GNAT superfamily N-acetyltransferase
VTGGAVEVRPITAPETHDLRARVLRTGTPSTSVTFPQDDLDGTVHLGAFLEGRLVGIGTFFPSPTPLRPEQPAVQLRGMAVEPSLQGTGAGRVLLEAAIGRLRAEGVHVLWANARDTALGFYERLGMEVVGDGFVSAETALPHHVVILDL